VAVHCHTALDAAEKVRDALPGAGHVVVHGDMADPEAVRSIVDGAADALGGLDVLVNNAGVYLPNGVFETSYEEWQQQWRRTLDTNLVGVANAVWCAARHMRDKGGRIINVSTALPT
jgi:3-oxoacyl-[acyl-carrier protein] reductase